MFIGKLGFEKTLLLTQESFQNVLMMLYQCAIQAQHAAPQM
ncbi:hypothetical protein LLB_2930 [Legionella longbeachae D-4968]|nr:hypothetical protein LLB_2930 [Legionella longbeachae D-4968]